MVVPGRVEKIFYIKTDTKSSNLVCLYPYVRRSCWHDKGTFRCQLKSPFHRIPETIGTSVTSAVDFGLHIIIMHPFEASLYEAIRSKADVEYSDLFYFTYDIVVVVSVEPNPSTSQSPAQRNESCCCRGYCGSTQGELEFTET
jgi:hypothetical protein